MKMRILRESGTASSTPVGGAVGGFVLRIRSARNQSSKQKTKRPLFGWRRWSARRRGRILRESGFAVCAALLALAPPAPASSPPAPAIDARLQGTFVMAGTVTQANHVLGEHRGQRVQRRWTFSATCSEGPCAEVDLARGLGGGRLQSIVLRRLGPGVYRGSGSFFVPLRCGETVYPHGGVVPYTVGVRIIAATPSSLGSLATTITATYTNRQRRNLTPCPGGIGSDAARYSGRLQGTPPPSSSSMPESRPTPTPESTPGPTPEPLPSPTPGSPPTPAPESTPTA